MNYLFCLFSHLVYLCAIIYKEAKRHEIKKE